MRASIHMIPIEDLEFNFFFNQDNQPTIEVEKKTYHSLYLLFRDFPILSDPHYPEKVAQVINFILKGLEFQYIENIEQFKATYQRQIEFEQASIDEWPTRLIDYGIYNVSVMHPPTIKNGKFIFFVKHEYTQIPYKVSLPFPISKESIKVNYELLPYL